MEVAPGLRWVTLQYWQLDEPLAAACLPTSQASQEVWPVAPCADPLGQAVQVADPALNANVPGEQAAQEDCPGVALAEPAAQLSQFACPVKLYVPEGQDVQFVVKPVE